MGKAAVLYRVASVIFILFAIGHTAGFLRFKAPSMEGQAVWDSMRSVQFPLGGSSRSYAEFYVGFGLFATLYLLFAAYLAWYLGGLAHSNPPAIGALGWMFFAVQIVSLILSWKYFLPPPVVLSGLAAICIGWASWIVA